MNRLVDLTDEQIMRKRQQIEKESKELKEKLARARCPKKTELHQRLEQLKEELTSLTNALWERYYDKITLFVMKRSSLVKILFGADIVTAEVEDIISSVGICVFVDRIKGYEPDRGKRFYGWFWWAVKSCFDNWTKKEKRHKDLLGKYVEEEYGDRVRVIPGEPNGDEESKVEILDERYSPDTGAMDREEKRLLEDAINKMQNEDSRIVWSHFVEGWKNKEIADATGIPLNTVKSHGLRGKNELRRILLSMKFDRYA